MRHLNKICEMNGGKIKEQDIPFCTGMIQIGKINWNLETIETYKKS